VEHHPPMVALYSEGKHWTMWQEFSMTTKFRANYVHLTPSGQSQCLDFRLFKNLGTRFSSFFTGGKF